MKDRIVEHPNRYQLTLVEGTTDTYDLTSVPGVVTEAGTAINKANLLTDATATAVWPNAAIRPTDPTVNAALGQLSVPDIKIGDVVTTVRTDLGDTYLLCNGAVVSSDDYSALSEVLPPEGRKYTTAYITDLLRIYAIYRYNGVWCAVGSNPSSSDCPCILTTTNPKGTWTYKQLATTSYLYLKGIYCYNGVWCAAGHVSGGYGYVFVTTDPTGTWTQIQLSSSNTVISSVSCYNGLWCAVGGSSGGGAAYIFTTTTPASTWTQNTQSGFYSFEDVVCVDGLWCAVSTAGVSTASDPAGTWTFQSLQVGMCFYKVAHYSGLWCIVGIASNYPCVYTTADPTGAWTKNTSESLRATTATSNIPGMYCYEGSWKFTVMNGSYDVYVFSSSNPAGEWSASSLVSGSDSSTYAPLFAYDSLWCCPASTGDIGSVRSYWLDLKAYKLPTISTTGAYDYIKALEG